MVGEIIRAKNHPGVEANIDIQVEPVIQYNPEYEMSIYDMAYRGYNLANTQYLYSTGGSPPFIPDGRRLTNTNEPYIDC